MRLPNEPTVDQHPWKLVLVPYEYAAYLNFFLLDLFEVFSVLFHNILVHSHFWYFTVAYFIIHVHFEYPGTFVYDALVCITSVKAASPCEITMFFGIWTGVLEQFVTKTWTGIYGTIFVLPLVPVMCSLRVILSDLIICRPAAADTESTADSDLDSITVRRETSTSTLIGLNVALQTSLLTL